MRFGAESSTSSLVLFGTLNFVAFATVATEDVLSYIMDLPPRTPSQALAPPPYQSPELDFAYTEVLTPYYHYYFYAPRFKASFLEHLNPQLFENLSPYNKWNPAQTLYPPQSYENEHEKFNDVRYPNYEIPPQRNFIENRYCPLHPNEYSPPSVSSFLPTALSSSTPNIIRGETEGKTLHSNIFKPNLYAPAFKDHKHTELNSIYKTMLKPLHSSEGPNIIRDEGFLINKLFKPVSSSYPDTATSNYHPFTAATLPHSYPTPGPSTLRTIFSDSAYETLNPIFTSSQSPVPGFTTASPLPQDNFPDRGGVVATERPPVLFEAPGHTVPRR